MQMTDPDFYITIWQVNPLGAEIPKHLEWGLNEATCASVPFVVAQMIQISSLFFLFWHWGSRLCSPELLADGELINLQSSADVQMLVKIEFRHGSS